MGEHQETFQAHRPTVRPSSSTKRRPGKSLGQGRHLGTAHDAARCSAGRPPRCCCACSCHHPCARQGARRSHPCPWAVGNRSRCRPARSTSGREVFEDEMPALGTPKVELGGPRVRFCAERAPGIALTGGCALVVARSGESPSAQILQNRLRRDQPHLPSHGSLLTTGAAWAALDC